MAYKLKNKKSVHKLYTNAFNEHEYTAKYNFK